MNDSTLWVLTWGAESGSFDSSPGFDYSTINAAVSLEIYFNSDGSQMYTTTSNPGKMHFFDLSEDRTQATLTKTLDTTGGAHHIAFTQDGQYAFVQYSLINLPGMNDGLVSIEDMQNAK